MAGIDPISLALSATTGGINSAIGLGQYLKGRKLAKDLVRPEYQIPTGITDNLMQAQQASFQGLPGQVQRYYQQQADRNQGQAISNLRNLRSGIIGVGAVNQAANDASMNIGAQNAAAIEQNRNRLYDMRSNLAEYQDKAWQLNKFQPYQEQAAAASALKGAGMQNIVGGLQTIAGGFAPGAGSADNAKTAGTPDATTKTEPDWLRRFRERRARMDVNPDLYSQYSQTA